MRSKNAAINVISAREAGGLLRDRGRDFDQKQKFGVKLPSPWDKISIQVPHPGKGFEFKV